MQIKDQQRLPQLTIAYLIDRSGSMGQIGRSGVPNLELAKARHCAVAGIAAAF